MSRKCRKYGEGFIEKTKMKRIEYAVRSGEKPGLSLIDEQPPLKRYEKILDEFYGCLFAFRDQVIAIDWALLDEKEKEIQTEDILKEVMSSSGDLQALAFDVGMEIGCCMEHELKRFLS